MLNCALKSFLIPIYCQISGPAPMCLVLLPILCQYLYSTKMANISCIDSIIGTSLHSLIVQNKLNHLVNTFLNKYFSGDMHA